MQHQHCPGVHSHLEEEHGHSPGPRPTERKRLILAMALTVAMMLVEFVAGILANSLALIGDAGHMLTHFVALAISFTAILIATSPASKRRTFGLYRTEILAALLNGVSVIVISLYIFYKAYLRVLRPERVASLEMLVVAVAGLIVNLIAAAILHKASREDINVKSAFIHLLGDTISSVGVIAAAVVIMFTGWYFLDPVVAVIIGIIIIWWGYQLIRDSVDILLESVPKGIDIQGLKVCACSHDKRIKDIHDVHVWQITSGMYAMTAHIVVDDMKLSESMAILTCIRECMDRHFHIAHVNIQFEPEGAHSTKKSSHTHDRHGHH